MSKFWYGLFALAYSFGALALEEPPRTTATTWEIYAVVLLVFVGGFVWVYFQQKKQREQDAKKRDSAPKS